MMQRCIALAKQGLYTVRQNPLVGCVIVKDEVVIAEGWHQLCGDSHAEINALKVAGEQAKGATVYVSLEPCCHQGKTGPCSEALIKAGISKLVFGMTDPNPQVAGKGVESIKEAGIEVYGPVLEKECEAINAGFIKRMRHGLPYVRCKLAMSLDGRTAMASGQSQWITGAESREDVQKLRASSDAIMTGLGTVLQDDPSLNVRLESEAFSQPLRVIVDSTLQTPASSKILTLPGDVLIATNSTDKDDGFPDQVHIKNFNEYAQGGKVNLTKLLQYLAKEKGCNNILLECGAGLAGAMLQAGLIDELITYVAPSLLGSEARPLFEMAGLSNMDDKVCLEFLDVSMLGKDCKMRSRVINVQ